MLTILFVIILISFIGVGLPDSVLGTAWPIIYREFNLPISLAGYITSTVSLGTIISSLLSAKLIKKLGTGLLTALSILLTAAALSGFAFAENAILFFLLAIPLGLGAGAIDTALNSFVALHYSASKMSFLHCFYGLGVAASPLIMSFSLGEDNNWRNGYLTVAVLQFFITAIIFISLPIWKKIQKKDMEEATAEQKTLTLTELIRIPAVRLSCFAFFASCALELTAGIWSSSYFVNTRGAEPDSAARYTMLFYIGLTGGRLLSGIFSSKLGRRKILRISLAVLLFALITFILPLPNIIASIALLFIGVGVGPIYPNLVHLTPKNFGEDIAQSVMGVQQAMTYVGIMLMPWLFGQLSRIFSTALLPIYLMCMFAFYVYTFIALMRNVKRNKK